MRVIGKKGFVDIAMPELIWLIVALIFFSVFFFFIYKTVSGATIYEEVYAKKIALAIDASRPGTVVSLDVLKALEIARKNEIPEESIRGGMVFVLDSNLHEVRVALTTNLGVLSYYSYNYFSDYPIEIKLVGDKLLIETK